MVTASFSAAPFKGKGFMLGIFLLIEVFLFGVAGAPSEPRGKLAPIEYNWDPANPPLRSIRPEDREFFTTGKSSSLQSRGEVAGVVPLNYTWDPQDPPPWTIRPEDRNNFLGGTMGSQMISQEANAGKSGEDPVPCANKNRPATLYNIYKANECPPKHKFLPFAEGMMRDSTCEQWNKKLYYEHSCTTFCETSTTFEWAQEVPFPHSECHYPIQCGMTDSESVSAGWNVGAGKKLQFWKALKIGVTGGWHNSWSTAKGKKWDVDLHEGQCGYFTFVPVKKVVCGGITEPAEPPAALDLGVCSSQPKNTPYCDNQLWTIKSNDLISPNKEIPDGTIIFVFTDCLTRLPLPMSKQDPVYQAPGVALSHSVLDGIKDSWVWNTCYLWNLGVNGMLSLYIHGSGFKDSMIGSNGGKLVERVSYCVRAAEGVMSDVEFTWYYSGYPGDDAKKTGAMWVFMADVPRNIRPGCLGDAILAVGGSTMDKCVGDKFGV